MVPDHKKTEQIQSRNKEKGEETYLVDGRYSLTIAIRFDCPTKSIPGNKISCTVHTTVIIKRGVMVN